MQSINRNHELTSGEYTLGDTHIGNSQIYCRKWLLLGLSNQRCGPGQCGRTFPLSVYPRLHPNPYAQPPQHSNRRYLCTSQKLIRSAFIDNCCQKTHEKNTVYCFTKVKVRNTCLHHLDSFLHGRREYFRFHQTCKFFGELRCSVHSYSHHSAQPWLELDRTFQQHIPGHHQLQRHLLLCALVQIKQNINLQADST